MKAILLRIFKRKDNETEHDREVRDVKRQLERLDMQLNLYERLMQERRRYKRGRFD